MIVVVIAIMPVVVTRLGMRIGRAMPIAKRHFVTMCITAILFVADGVKSPVRMRSFPIMKERPPARIQAQPDMVGTQIILKTAVENQPEEVGAG